VAFVNPIGRGLSGERVDMGVDYGGHGSLYAMGSGVITSIRNSGWPGGAFIGLHLDSGQYMYYAEDIIPHVSIGQRVQAGQLVGTATGGASGIEVGWAAPPGTGQTMAAQAGQAAKGSDPGEFPTAYGVSMSNLIKSLGGPAGKVSGPITGGIPANQAQLYGSGAAQTAGLGNLTGCAPLIYWIWVIWNATHTTRTKNESRHGQNLRQEKRHAGFLRHRKQAARTGN
jgi:hypothetical protein